MANGTTSTSTAIAKVSDVQTTLVNLLTALDTLPAVRKDLKAQLDDQRFTLLTTIAKDLVDAKGDRAADDRAIEKYRTTKTTTVDKLEAQLAALRSIEDAWKAQIATIIENDGADAIAVIRRQISQIETQAEKQEEEAKKLKDLVADAGLKGHGRRIDPSVEIEAAKQELEASIGSVRNEATASLRSVKSDLEIAIDSVRAELLRKLRQLAVDVHKQRAKNPGDEQKLDDDDAVQAAAARRVDEEVAMQKVAENGAKEGDDGHPKQAHDALQANPPRKRRRRNPRARA